MGFKKCGSARAGSYGLLGAGKPVSHLGSESLLLVDAPAVCALHCSALHTAQHGTARHSTALHCTSDASKEQN